MSNTLGLDDDLESVAIVELLEESFGLGFTDAEVESWVTVGDIYAALLQRYGATEHGGKCATAMAFYRLRRAIKSLAAESTLRPDTSLEGLTDLPPRMLFKRLKNNTGLRLPAVRRSRLGNTWIVVGMAAALGAGGLAVAGSPWWWVAFLGCLVGFLAARRDGGKLDRSSATLGSLAECVAGLNFGALVIEGAGRRDKEIWKALIEVLATYSLLPKGEIRPDTVVLRSQIKST